VVVVYHIVLRGTEIKVAETLAETVDRIIGLRNMARRGVAFGIWQVCDFSYDDVFFSSAFSFSDITTTIAK